MLNRKSKGISIISIVIILLMVTSGIVLAEDNINDDSESNELLKTSKKGT